MDLFFYGAEEQIFTDCSSEFGLLKFSINFHKKTPALESF